MELETPTPAELRKLRTLAVEYYRYREKIFDRYFLSLLEMPEDPDFDEDEYYRMLEMWAEELNKEGYHYRFRLDRGLTIRDNMFGYIQYEARRRLRQKKDEEATPQ